MLIPNRPFHPLSSTRSPAAAGAAGLLVLSLALSGCVHVNRHGAASAPRSQQSRQEGKRFPVKPGMIVELVNLAGRVDAEGQAAHEGGEIEINATLHAAGHSEAEAKALLEKLTIKYEDLGDRILVRASYPVDEYDSYYYPDWPGDGEGGHFVGIRVDSSPSDSLRVCTSDFFGGGCRSNFRYQDTRVSVSGSPRRGGAALYADFHLSLPAGTGVKINNYVGSIALKRIEGPASAETGAGNIVSGPGRGALTVSTGSGLIVVQDHFGTVRAETGSGDMHIARVKGNVKADTGSGDIKLEELEGDKIETESGSGDVHFERVTGNLHAETGSGDVTGDEYRAGSNVYADTGSGAVSLSGDLSAAKEISIDTGSGDVELKLSALPQMKLKVSTGSGTISVDVPELRGVHASDGEYEAELGNGEAKFKIETGSGDATLRLGAEPPKPPVPPSFDAIPPVPPIAMEKPAKPAKPAKAAKPAAPAEPARPATPAKPAKPAEPAL